MTKKYVVWADEYYPFYTLNEVEGNPFGREVPDEFVERYDRVMREFAELQSELGAI